MNPVRNIKSYSENKISNGMKILAIVAARAGSKGIKNKNIRDLMGKPLIVYTIEQLKRWGKYDRFIVSTDSKEIARIAKDYGVDVPFLRPVELAGDNIGKVEVLRHALERAEEYYGKEFDALLDLDATAPVRTIEDIDNMVNLFQKKKANCVLSLVEAHKNPYFNMLEKNEDGTLKVCKPTGSDILTRQAAPVVYKANASIYIYDRQFLLDVNTKTPLSDKTFGYEMDELSAVDIDREIDFKFIEFLVKEGLVKL